MSIDATNWVWKFSQTEGNDRLVLLALADFCSIHEGESDCAGWPSKTTLAAMTRLSTSTVRRSLKVAEELGEIFSAPYDAWSGPANRRPNRYVFLAVDNEESWGSRLTPVSKDDLGVSNSPIRGVTADIQTITSKPLSKTAADFSKKTEPKFVVKDYPDHETEFADYPRASKESLLSGVEQARAALKAVTEVGDGDATKEA